MKTLFLTRKFPPKQGGMETFSYQLTEQFTGEKEVIHHGAKQRDIIWVVPLMILKTLTRLKTTQLIHLGDLVLAPVAHILKFFTHIPIVVTVHGLELTFQSGLLRLLINSSLNSIDHFVCVSENTARLLKERGVDDARISIIAHGAVPVEPKHRGKARNIICKSAGIQPQETNDAIFLLTVGRHVKRKGVAWFIDTVLPKLEGIPYYYLVTSDGPDRFAIESTIAKRQLEDKVKLLGKVSDEILQVLYSGSDIFVMPNIPVEGDVEGFGFVAIEAASYGLPVISSDIDGIAGAVHHEKNGILVTASDAEAYATHIREWAANEETRRTFGEKARLYTLEHFDWKHIVQEYTDLFQKIISPQRS